jgi:hypothetical protein
MLRYCVRWLSALKLRSLLRWIGPFVNGTDSGSNGVIAVDERERLIRNLDGVQEIRQPLCDRRTVTDIERECAFNAYADVAAYNAQEPDRPILCVSCESVALQPFVDGHRRFCLQQVATNGSRMIDATELTCHVCALPMHCESWTIQHSSDGIRGSIQRWWTCACGAHSTQIEPLSPTLVETLRRAAEIAWGSQPC